MAESAKVVKARKLAYDTATPITELKADVQDLYDSTTDPAEQRQIGAYLAVLKQRGLVAERDSSKVTPVVKAPVVHKPPPFGDPSRFVVQKGDLREVKDDSTTGSTDGA